MLRNKFYKKCLKLCCIQACLKHLVLLFTAVVSHRRYLIKEQLSILFWALFELAKILVFTPYFVVEKFSSNKLNLVWVYVFVKVLKTSETNLEPLQYIIV